MDPMEKVFMELFPSFDERIQKLYQNPEINYEIPDSPFYKKMSKELVEIRIDPEKCTSPGHCLKCMQACAPKVFCWEWKPVGPFGGAKAFGIQERPARMWGAHAMLCTVCNRCVEICPEKAITVIPAEDTGVAFQLDD